MIAIEHLSFQRETLKGSHIVQLDSKHLNMMTDWKDMLSVIAGQVISPVLLTICVHGFHDRAQPSTTGVLDPRRQLFCHWPTYILLPGNLWTKRIETDVVQRGDMRVATGCLSTSNTQLVVSNNNNQQVTETAIPNYLSTTTTIISLLANTYKYSASYYEPNNDRLVANEPMTSSLLWNQSTNRLLAFAA